MVWKFSNGRSSISRRQRIITHSVKRTGFSLIELLVVMAVVAILIALLLPALTTARSVSRQTVCMTRLQSLGQSMQNYCSAYNEWIPGSPNTSGNRANPGGWRIKLSTGEYYVWDNTSDAFPAIHIFDWASPLLLMMGTSIPSAVPERYDLVKKWAFRCPENNYAVKLNHATRIKLETIVSSYATSRFFTYVPISLKNGSSPGTLFWAEDCIPESYCPKIDRIESISDKVFLADSCRVDRGNPDEISNMDYGYTDRGAWLNVSDPQTSSVSLSYRFEPARSNAYRHRNGINLLFFDGHVSYQHEGSSEDCNGFGSGSRQAKFWFPSGTKSSNIPSWSSYRNESIIIP